MRPTVLVQKMLAASRWGVPRRVFCRTALWQALHPRVEVRLEEKRDRIPLLASADYPAQVRPWEFSNKEGILRKAGLMQSLDTSEKGCSHDFRWFFRVL